MSLIAFFSSLLLQVFLFCREGEAAVTAFTSKASDPTYAQETFNITLLWSYTLNGAVGSAKFVNSTGDGDVSIIIANKFGSGSTNVQLDFQERFRADISDTQAWLTIVNVQRSDQGDYQFEMTPTMGNGITDEVKLIVQYPPVITDISDNQTVNENDNITLNYTISDYGNPQVNINWTRLSDNSNVTFPLTITGTKDQGFYRLTADNGVGSAFTADVFITVENYSPENTILTTNLGADNTVVVNTTFNLTCRAQANPPAKYRFYKEQEIKFTTTNSSNVAVYTTSVTEGINQVKFSCTPFNDYGDGPTAMATVIVHYPPKIINAPLSQSLEEGSEAILFCNASGNPKPNITWTKLGSNSAFPTSESLTLTNLKKEDDGVYKCLVQNDLGPVEATATITVLYAPTVTIQRCSTPVTEGDNATLYCNATGNPVPSTAWLRAGQVETNDKMLVLAAIKRNESGNYECLAGNGIGNNSTKSCTIDVQYPPEIINNETEMSINVTNDGTIKGKAKGNPIPSFVWRNASGSVKTINSVLSLVKVTDSDGGNYTCTATNKLGSDNYTILVRVTRGNVTVDATVEGEYSQDYDDLSKPDTIDFVKLFEEGVKTWYKNTDHFGGIKVLRIRKGSVIVSFVLYFTTPVTLNEGLAELRDAVDNGTIGPYKVKDLKIIPDVNPTTTPVLSTGSTTAPVKTTKKTTPAPTGGLPWAIIAGAVGGALVLIVIIAVVVWWMHKKRKCKKDTKIGHDPESEEALRGQPETGYNDHGQVNGGYADSGPPSANGTDAAQQQATAAAAPPTYAVVDKSKKKKKDKKDKNKVNKNEDQSDAEQNIPQYAVVDKSQKKKKEVVEDAYAQVDMSKKSKKKAKPGEMLYADLGDFQPREMPAVSTSPDPLPPIKRPPAYEETQYADITQYLKGDVKLPGTNNSQGTEMTSANVEGSKGKPKETANGGGNEEKPKDTANGGGNEEKPKETRM